MVSELLTQADVALQELDAIAFGRGPGGFTGVRLAASVTQGLAFGAAVRVVPVSDLQALAQRLLLQEPAVARVLVCTDARMREVYCGAFERSAGGLALAVEAERVVAPEAVKLPASWAPTQTSAWAARSWRTLSCPRRCPGWRYGRGCGRGRRRLRSSRCRRLAPGAPLRPAQALPVYLRDDVARAADPGGQVINLTAHGHLS